MPKFFVVAFMDCDEYYGAYIFTPAGTYFAGSKSLALLAEVSEDRCKAIEGYAPHECKYEWLGLLADVSENHVRECVAELVRE